MRTLGIQEPDTQGVSSRFSDSAEVFLCFTPNNPQLFSEIYNIKRLLIPFLVDTNLEWIIKGCKWGLIGAMLHKLVSFKTSSVQMGSKAGRCFSWQTWSTAVDPIWTLLVLNERCYATYTLYTSLTNFSTSFIVSCSVTLCQLEQHQLEKAKSSQGILRNFNLLMYRSCRFSECKVLHNTHGSIKIDLGWFWQKSRSLVHNAFLTSLKKTRLETFEI